MFSPDLQEPVVFDGILGKHQGNSFEDDLPLHPPIDLSEEGENDLSDRLYSSLLFYHPLSVLLFYHHSVG